MSSMKVGWSRHSRNISALTDDRQQTAVRSSPRWSGPGVQHDLRAQVRLAHLQTQLALVLGHGPVHRVGEDQVGLARLQAELQHLLPQGAGVDLAHHLAGLGRAQGERGAVAHRLHELVGDGDAVVQVQRLAVEVAARVCGSRGTPRSPDGGCRYRPPPSRAAGEPWLMARVRLSITRMKGMMPLVWPAPFTFSPMERTPPQ